MKKFTSIILSIILAIIINLSLTMPVVAEGTSAGTTFQTAITELKAKGTCYSETLGDPLLLEIAKGSKIVTELEEGLGDSEDFGSNAKVVNCFRVTGCKKGKNGNPDKSICRSWLNNKCDLEPGKQQYIEIEKNLDDPVEEGPKTTKMKVSAVKKSCTKIQIIVSEAGTGLFYAYIGMVYRWAASIIGIVAVLIIIINGIIISAAGGEPGTVDEARGRIIRALLGLAVLFMASLILYTINPEFFVK